MAFRSQRSRQSKRTRRLWVRMVIGVVLLPLLGGGILMINVWSALGTKPGGERLARIQQSPQFQDGQFVNTLPSMEKPILPMLKKWFTAPTGQREPTEPIPVVARTPSEFREPPSEARVTWLGHSSILIELDGQRILTDPVWGDYASPGAIFGVKRFYAPPLALDDLPPLDAVVLSHDHYDHLNEPTIRQLKDRVPVFIMPLGLGAHLEYWGVAPERIIELDWWEETQVGDVRLVATPARHFSGRALVDRDATLWSSWAIIGAEQRVYFSGDTGMFPGFTEIGERLGPFDITLMESGAYNPLWSDIHMGPEQAVQAHQMVRGNILVPIHWGTFNLAYHTWTEPVERILAATEARDIPVVIPRPGASIVAGSPQPVERWWPTLPWQTATETPIVSPGL